MNEKQAKVVKFLAENKGTQFTLAEISEKVGDTLKSGTTNVLVAKGLIVCHKNERELVCPHCGHKSKVSTYEIA